MKLKAFQIDLGRQIERPDFVEKWIPRHAEWGYNVLMLYLEDAYRFPSHPEFAQRKAWTPLQMEMIVRTASKYGVSVIPIVPALGHTAYILKHPKYRHLSEKREQLGEDGLPILAGQVCPSLDGTFELFEDLFADVAPFCTAGYLHIGLDESFDLGVCSVCRPKISSPNQGPLFIEHLKRLRELVNRLKLRTAIWGDMFYYFPERIKDVPKDVAIFDWNYYPFRRVPRVELFNFSEVDSAGVLVKAGLETWACPNNGPFFCETHPPVADRLRNIESWWRYGGKSGCHALAITSWSPIYAPSELNFLVNAAAADLWLAPGKAFDPKRMIEHGLRRIYGSGGAQWSRLVAQLDADHLAGYWKYQIVQSRLIKTAIVEKGDRLAKKTDTYKKISASARKAPGALAGAFTIRQYHLAKERLSAMGSGLIYKARQAFSASDASGAHKAVVDIERLLGTAVSFAKPALAATKELWRGARYASEPDPLAKLIRDDLEEYKLLARYLRCYTKKPASVMDSCPLLSRRQLLVKVRNRKPCLQGLQIEMSEDGSIFKSLHCLYLLEFSADAGQPRTNFVHTHTISIPDGIASDKFFFRFRSSGIGEVEIKKPVLIDGAKLRKPTRLLGHKGRVVNPKHLISGGWVELGCKAPKAGLPSVSDFQTDNHLDVLFE